MLRLMETPPKHAVTPAAQPEETVKATLKAERAMRLAAALRTNLKRRKAPRLASPPADDRN
ncbi:hypothetical protein ACFPIF_02545 [Brevundimonas faecalis]|uniref:Uncharacterized protein n=2 Tax=Brevundimonas faecalis TaxID=947378 RepID=A0ABV2R8T3_9CAUL